MRCANLAVPVAIMRDVTRGRNHRRIQIPRDATAVEAQRGVALLGGDRALNCKRAPLHLKVLPDPVCGYLSGVP